MFDVDWMRGMSFGLFPVETGDPEAIAQELDTVFANDQEGPTKGMVRFVPNRRLKAILVITSRPEYLKKAETWLRRLDMVGQATEKQVHVYHIQHRPAGELAQLLQKIYGQQDPGGPHAHHMATVSTCRMRYAQPTPPRCPRHTGPNRLTPRAYHRTGAGLDIAPALARRGQRALGTRRP